MKQRVRVAVLVFPFILGIFFTLILLPSSPLGGSYSRSHRKEKGSQTRVDPLPSNPVTVLDQHPPLTTPAVSMEGEPQPVVTFVQSGSHEKISDLISQHREEEAIALLEERVRTRPQDLQAHMLLGSLHYKKDHLAEAISAWETVLKADPQNLSVKDQLERALREQKAQSGFTREMTRHFTIKFEGTQSRYLYQTVLGILEEAYGTVGRALQFYPNQEVIVFLYTDQQFFDVTRAPAWSGGIFDGKIRIPSKGFETHLDEMKEVLVHEYVHAVIYQIIHARLSEKQKGTVTPLPTWLNEGIAQYLSLPPQNNRILSRLQKGIQRGVFIKISTLHGSFLGLDALQAALAYDESLSAVSYLVETFGLWRFKGVIEAFVDHGNMDEAMRSALLISYGQFQSQWEESLKG